MPLYSLKGRAPILPASGRVFIAPGAHVIGRVRLGEDVGIWFGAVVRGDNDDIEIGDVTNIQENAVLHVDPGFPMKIGAGCTIGHAAMVHGCTIGPNTLVGMGAIVMNGAKIGANCLIGAGALVPEGKEYPDSALIVGTPAKAIRTLEEAQIEHLRRAARVYQAKAQSFPHDLVEIHQPGPTPAR